MCDIACVSRFNSINIFLRKYFNDLSHTRWKKSQLSYSKITIALIFFRFRFYFSFFAFPSVDELLHNPKKKCYHVSEREREKNIKEEEGKKAIFKDSQNRYVCEGKKLHWHCTHSNIFFPSTSRDSLLMLQNIQQEMVYFFSVLICKTYRFNIPRRLGCFCFLFIYFLTEVTSNNYKFFSFLLI